MNNEVFALDPRNAKWMGVCAGLARRTGLDLTLVRVLAVLALLMTGPIVILAYLLIGLVAGSR